MNYHHSIKYFLTVLIKAVFAVFLFLPFYVSAYFTNTETAPVQQFAAGQLSLEPVFNEEVYLGPQITPVDLTVNIFLTEGSIAAQHDMVVEEFGGDLSLCTGLDLTLKNPAGYTTTGSLVGLVGSSTNQFGNWDFTFSYPTNLAQIPHGATCAIKFKTTAWQSNMTKSTAGFRHDQTFIVTISIGAVVLNEILVSPNTNLNEVEFIELYNFSGLPVDVAGWNIAERTSANQVINHFISGTSTGAAADLIALDGSFTTVISPGGFLALRYRGASSYLNDNGDTVTLIETPTGRVLDEFTYGIALRSDTFSRVPDGFGAWVTASSTPNATNGSLSLTATEDINSNDSKPIEEENDEPVSGPETTPEIVSPEDSTEEEPITQLLPEETGGGVVGPIIESGSDLVDTPYRETNFTEEDTPAASESTVDDQDDNNSSPTEDVFDLMDKLHSSDDSVGQTLLTDFDYHQNGHESLLEGTVEPPLYLMVKTT